MTKQRELKEEKTSLFTRTDLSLSIKINFNMTRLKRSPPFYIILFEIEKRVAPSSIHNYSILFFDNCKRQRAKIFKLVKTKSVLDFLKNNTSLASAWEGITFNKIQGIVFQLSTTRILHFLVWNNYRNKDERFHFADDLMMSWWLLYLGWWTAPDYVSRTGGGRIYAVLCPHYHVEHETNKI